jgi:SEC-C motif-containing protein
MRSRYSAFVKQDIDYLLATLHVSQRRADDRQILQQTCQQTNWLGLQIIASHARDQYSEVEFVAFYAAEPLGQLHERSRFICENGQWQYVDGDFLPDLKLPRNTPCICGSGLKFKHCHGR